VENWLSIDNQFSQQALGLVSLRVKGCAFIIDHKQPKSTGVPVKGDHVEGLCQLSLKKVTAVEGKWVACLIQDIVNWKDFVSVNFL
jgi:hypothetical protein